VRSRLFLDPQYGVFLFFPTTFGPATLSCSTIGSEAGNGEVATVTFAVGDALGDALVRPGRVVVRLVFSQDGAEVVLAGDQDAVEDLSAPCSMSTGT
jgi:hypothetical protein